MQITKSNYIDLICPICDKSFKKRVGDYNRSIKFENNIYCSKKCAASGRKKDPIDVGIKKLFLSISWKKTPNNSTRITYEYLRTLWDKQNGKCSISKNSMLVNNWNKNNKSQYSASIDRIDNSIGYIEGNIRLVCQIINLGMNEFTDEDFLTFCKAVAEYNK